MVVRARDLIGHAWWVAQGKWSNQNSAVPTTAPVFQPTYILEAPGESSQYLSDVARKHRQHESLLCSVLTETLTAGEQRMKARSRVNTAAKNVFACMEGLFVDQPRKDRFKSELEEFCRQACDLWQYIQTLEEIVTLSFDLYGSTDWKVLEFNLPMSSGTGPKANPSGSASA